jgi:hypothetical protein
MPVFSAFYTGQSSFLDMFLEREREREKEI